MTSNNINPEFINSIKEAKQNQNLVFFIGAGVSMSQGYPNWTGYVNHLIDYWKFNDKVTHSNLELVKFLDWLGKSDLTNARKIDVIQYLIEKDNEDNPNLVTKFENQYFGHMQVLANHNDLLRELTKLKATYITTNYDSGIETELLDIEFASVIPSSIEFDKQFKEKTLDVGPKVIYLHGRYDSSSKDIINSSSRYADFYYDNTPHQIGSFLKDKVVVFVGSSLQEDELLNILKLENTKQCFALMKEYSSSIINNNIADYYSKRHNVNIEWYGNNFDDLLPFVHEMVAMVNGVERLDSKTKQDFKNIKDKNKFISAINKIISTKNYLQFDILLGEMALVGIDAENVIKWIAKSDAVNNLRFLQSNNLWNLLAEYFDKLDTGQQKIWLEKIKLGQGITRESLDDIFTIFQKYADVTDVSINDIVKSYLSVWGAYTSIDNKLIDGDVLGHFIVEDLINSNDFVIFNHSDLASKQIKLSVEDRNKLIEFINKGFTKEGIGNPVVYEIKMLNNESKLEYIIKLIINKNFNREDIIEFVDNCSVIQKYLVYYDIQTGLDKETLEILRDYINLDEKLLGPYMNKFVKKYNLNSNLIYVDGIYNVPMKNDNPFISNGVIDYDGITDTLIKVDRSGEFDNVHNKFEWALQTLRSAIDDNKIQTICSRILSNSSTFPKETIESILWDAKLYLGNDFYRNLFINYVSNNKLYYRSQFDLINTLIEKELSSEELNKIIDNLKQVKITELSTKSGVINENQDYLDINMVLNSDLGSYFYLLHQKCKQLKVSENVKDYFDGIDDIDLKWSNFMKGMFYQLLEDYKIDRSSIDTFVGYSNSYQGFSNNESSLWINSVINIIKTDNFNTAGNPYIAYNVSICIFKNSETFTDSINKYFSNKFMDEIFINLVNFMFGGNQDINRLIDLFCSKDDRFQDKLISMLFSRFENLDVVQKLIYILKRNNYDDSVEISKFYSCQITLDNVGKFVDFCNVISRNFTISDIYRQCFSFLDSKTSVINKINMKKLVKLFGNYLTNQEKNSLVQKANNG